MPRRPRSLLPDGFFHVTSRGVAQTAIFLDQLHFAVFMQILEAVTEKVEWACHRYCVLPNHYHLVVETRRPELSHAMQRLNGRYAHWFNEIHDRTGHVFQNRFDARVIDGEEHYEAALAYVDSNPVRAGLVERPEDWPWSSSGRRTWPLGARVHG
jgi:putative transposase